MFIRLSRNQMTRIPSALLVGVILVVAFASYQLAMKIAPSLMQQPAPQTADTGGAAVVTPPYLLPDFTLTSHTGDPVSLSDFRGRSVLLFFGYTHCPDICPTTLADYRRVKSQLGARAEDVAFVFISVDGARDTPEVMAKYLSMFDADFIGLTGGEEIMREIGTDYGLSFSADKQVNVGHSHDDDTAEHHHDDEDYFVEHTSPSFLVDPDGYLRLVYFYGTKPEVMVSSIQQIMTEQAS
ncbi:MAG: SCO family protein [Anaerolineae bacterium]|nr:SCO family protein [Anaerolineae bacterium]